MKLPTLKLGDLVVPVPIIQGAMGVGISLSKLASAVANEGGIGVIAGVQIGFKEPDFETNTIRANITALKKEIKKARELSLKGIIGVNLMVAIKNYKEMVKAAVGEKIDLIISGAGLPKDLPEFIKGSKTKIAPVVSSGKAAALIAKLWDRRFSYIPDLIIVEGTDAGGHLGYSLEDLNKEDKPMLIDTVKEVIETIKPFEKKYDKKIPVIAAGGIFSGTDIAKYLKVGASGVQMGTRFVATEECDAHKNFKETYLKSNEADIQLIRSPVGMPGRAIKNKLIERIKLAKIPVTKCYNCLEPCNPETTPYCISAALIKAAEGDIDEGLIFAGTNAYRLNKITTVKELMRELVTEAEQALI